MSLLKVTNVLECPIKSDHYISEKKKQPYCCCGILFCRLRNFKILSIFMKITTKVPICSRIGPKKVPILPESPFFPYYNIFQH